MSRIAKNRYKWHGKLNLATTLLNLRALADFENICEQIHNVKDFELNQHLEDSHIRQSQLAFSGQNSNSSVCLSSSNSMSADGEGEVDEISRGASLDSRKEKSLGVMSQKFLMLFLVSKPKIVHLDFAAKILIGDANVDKTESGKFKTKIRRLYDIANILTSLSLIQKVHVTEVRGRKPAFQYIGPDIDILDPKALNEENVRPLSKHSLLENPIKKITTVSDVSLLRHIPIRPLIKKGTENTAPAVINSAVLKRPLFDSSYSRSVEKKTKFGRTRSEDFSSKSKRINKSSRSLVRHGSLHEICEVAEMERQRLFSSDEGISNDSTEVNCERTTAHQENTTHKASFPPDVVAQGTQLQNVPPVTTILLVQRRPLQLLPFSNQSNQPAKHFPGLFSSESSTSCHSMTVPTSLTLPQVTSENDVKSSVPRAAEQNLTGTSLALNHNTTTGQTNNLASMANMSVHCQTAVNSQVSHLRTPSTNIISPPTVLTLTKEQYTSLMGSLKVVPTLVSPSCASRPSHNDAIAQATIPAPNSTHSVMYVAPPQKSIVAADRSSIRFTTPDKASTGSPTSFIDIRSNILQTDCVMNLTVPKQSNVHSSSSIHKEQDLSSVLQLNDKFTNSKDVLLTPRHMQVINGNSLCSTPKSVSKVSQKNSTCSNSKFEIVNSSVPDCELISLKQSTASGVDFESPSSLCSNKTSGLKSPYMWIMNDAHCSPAPVTPRSISTRDQASQVNLDADVNASSELHSTPLGAQRCQSRNENSNSSSCSELDSTKCGDVLLSCPVGMNLVTPTSGKQNAISSTTPVLFNVTSPPKVNVVTSLKPYIIGSTFPDRIFQYTGNTLTPLSQPPLQIMPIIARESTSPNLSVLKSIAQTSPLVSFVPGVSNGSSSTLTTVNTVQSQRFTPELMDKEDSTRVRSCRLVRCNSVSRRLPMSR